MKNIWQSLPKPIFALAPMEDVTDTVFRQIIASFARPDIFYTEFTNCDGLLSKGYETVSLRLRYDKSEHPIIAQLWGIHPEAFKKAAKQIADLGFDGVDINMGCPHRSVVSRCACAALIKDHALAQSIVLATKKGVSGRIPVSIKTRIGYNTIDTEHWISFLLSLDIDALIIHGRTAKEMSAVSAHWDEIGKAVKMRNALRIKTVILGNGDIENAHDAQEKCKTYGLDGAMIGRGVLVNPWCFDRSPKPHRATRSELLFLMKRHTKLFEKTWGSQKNFSILKKFFKVYIRDFKGAQAIRVRAMEAKSFSDIYKLSTHTGCA